MLIRSDYLLKKNTLLKNKISALKYQAVFFLIFRQTDDKIVFSPNIYHPYSSL